MSGYCLESGWSGDTNYWSFSEVITEWSNSKLQYWFLNKQRLFWSILLHWSKFDDILNAQYKLPQEGIPINMKTFDLRGKRKLDQQQLKNTIFPELYFPDFDAVRASRYCDAFSPAHYK